MFCQWDTWQPQGELWVRRDGPYRIPDSGYGGIRRGYGAGDYLLKLPQAGFMDATSLALDDLLFALRRLAHDCGRVAHRLGGHNRARLKALKRIAYSALMSGGAAENLLLALSRFAREANEVAHALPKQEREPVFALKSAALSELISCRAAILNDVSADGTAGLDLLLLPGKRIHCPLSLLAPLARAIARREAAFVPVSAPMFDCVNPAQREGLLRLVGRAA